MLEGISKEHSATSYMLDMINYALTELGIDKVGFEVIKDLKTHYTALDVVRTLYKNNKIERAEINVEFTNSTGAAGNTRYNLEGIADLWKRYPEVKAFLDASKSQKVDTVYS